MEVVPPKPVLCPAGQSAFCLRVAASSKAKEMRKDLVLYLPVKQQLYQEDLGDYQSFGIAAWNFPQLNRKPIVFIPDVTPDRKLAGSLCWHCTWGQLAPKQLIDVVEDSI